MVGVALLIVALGSGTAAEPAAISPTAVRESAREIPVVARADVLVVGDSSGAVAAAAEAARAGATVLLITHRPYLGGDLCATLRLWRSPDEKVTTPLAKRLLEESPARPMHIKRTLDQELLDAGAHFFFGCYATDLLRDASGQIAGIAMANRAGRQAILAQVIIDATDRATVARLAGAQFAAYPSGSAEFRRVGIGGAPQPAEGVVVRPLTGNWFGGNKPNAAFECTLTIPVADGSYASFAAAEQRARDLTFHPQQLDASPELHQVPPDAMAGVAQETGTTLAAERVDLAISRPRDVSCVFVLGGCMALSRAAAADSLRPDALIVLGARIGRAAADQARTLRGRGKVHVVRTPPPDGVPGDVREPLAGLRPVQRDLPTVCSPERGIPVIGRYDVIVVGGGTSGAAAGIGAARRGARTLVVEYQHSLGGVGTLGLIGNYWYGVRTGFTAEVDQGVARLGAKVKVIGKAEWWRQELRRAGADVWLGVLGCGAVVDRGRVRGVVVATPQGRGVVLAQVVIDATGNADIAAAAGAACEFVDESDLSLQLAGLPARKLGDSYVNTCYMYTDDADIVDLSQLLVYAKDRFRDAYDLGTLVDSRERRRIRGDYVLTPIDVHAARTYPDTISVHSSNYDMYGFPVHPLYLLATPPKAKEVRCYLPYRCLLPQGLEGLLVAGIGLSADHDVLPIVRMQPDMQNLGFAAGTAAALAVKTGQPLRAIDVKALQRQLIDASNLPPEVLQHTDSFPVGAERLRAAVAGERDNLEQLAILFSAPDAALPLVREAYRRAPAGPNRLSDARWLAMWGDKTGLPTLVDAVAGAAWDRGQNIVTSGESGANYSRLDLLILALGRTSDRAAVEPICAKARLLEPDSGLSHFRAVAIALETIADPAAAPVLAGLLHKPGMTGHAITTLSDARRKRGEEERGQGRTVRLVNPAVRELTLARALYRCGDHGGLGERILREYERDLQGPLACHAHAALHSRPGRVGKP
jgi:ribulose 1,5-bisphosphate synthetase/thiazole synthase